jgi:hypothetical protein
MGREATCSGKDGLQEMIIDLYATTYEDDCKVVAYSAIIIS